MEEQGNATMNVGDKQQNNECVDACWLGVAQHLLPFAIMGFVACVSCVGCSIQRLKRLWNKRPIAATAVVVRSDNRSLSHRPINVARSRNSTTPKVKSSANGPLHHESEYNGEGEAYKLPSYEVAKALPTVPVTDMPEMDNPDPEQQSQC
eukprot:scpid78804/ scgid16561/ 